MPRVAAPDFRSFAAVARDLAQEQLERQRLGQASRAAQTQARIARERMQIGAQLDVARLQQQREIAGAGLAMQERGMGLREDELAQRAFQQTQDRAFRQQQAERASQVRERQFAASEARTAIEFGFRWNPASGQREPIREGDVYWPERRRFLAEKEAEKERKKCEELRKEERLGYVREAHELRMRAGERQLAAPAPLTFEQKKALDYAYWERKEVFSHQLGLVSEAGKRNIQLEFERAKQNLEPPERKIAAELFKQWNETTDILADLYTRRTSFIDRGLKTGGREVEQIVNEDGTTDYVTPFDPEIQRYEATAHAQYGELVDRGALKSPTPPAVEFGAVGQPHEITMTDWVRQVGGADPGVTTAPVERLYELFFMQGKDIEDPEVRTHWKNLTPAQKDAAVLVLGASGTLGEMKLEQGAR